MHLPDAGALRARLRRRHPDAVEHDPAPPPWDDAVRRITALLEGGSQDDFADIPIDWGSETDFNRYVYEVARTIPPGSTLCYGEIAQRLGTPEAAQSVGRALGQNRWALVVPCHRVLAADGRPGGFSARGGVELKLRLLAIEGAAVGGTRLLF